MADNERGFHEGNLIAEIEDTRKDLFMIADKVLLYADGNTEDASAKTLRLYAEHAAATKEVERLIGMGQTYFPDCNWGAYTLPVTSSIMFPILEDRIKRVADAPGSIKFSLRFNSRPE